MFAMAATLGGAIALCEKGHGNTRWVSCFSAPGADISKLRSRVLVSRFGFMCDRDHSNMFGCLVASLFVRRAERWA